MSKNKFNLISKKETDIMDPEAKAKDTRKKGLTEKVQDAAKKVKDAVNNLRKIAEFVSAIGPWGVLIIVIIIIIIGLIGALMNIPGLAMQKLKELAIRFN